MLVSDLTFLTWLMLVSDLTFLTFQLEHGFERQVNQISTRCKVAKTQCGVVQINLFKDIYGG